jgi:hypothetical protein
MTIRYYMDVQFPFSITDQLRLREVDVLTAQEDGVDCEGHRIIRVGQSRRVSTV